MEINDIKNLWDAEKTCRNARNLFGAKGNDPYAFGTDSERNEIHVFKDCISF